MRLMSALLHLPTLLTCKRSPHISYGIGLTSTAYTVYTMYTYKAESMHTTPSLRYGKVERPAYIADSVPRNLELRSNATS